MPLKLLDLYCGAGGAAMGYHRAGFDQIVGVDIVPQPNYPFEFVEGDAMDFLRLLVNRGWGDEFGPFDLIHASPPCQRYSVMTATRTDHPDLIAMTRALLNAAGTPWIIENVQGAPVMGHLKLCGSMFGLDIQRHRLFELSGFSAMAPGGCNHKGWKSGGPWLVTGHLHTTAQLHLRHRKPAASDAAALMGMPSGLPVLAYTEAIPPAYTEYLGRQFLDQLGRVA